MLVFLSVREDARIGAYENLYLKISNNLKTRSISFSQSTECLISDLHPELLSAGVEGQQLAVVMI